jgi:hypothetical protein
MYKCCRLLFDCISGNDWICACENVQGEIIVVTEETGRYYQGYLESDPERVSGTVPSNFVREIDDGSTGRVSPAGRTRYDRDEVEDPW